MVHSHTRTRWEGRAGAIGPLPIPITFLRRGGSLGRLQGGWATDNGGDAPRDYREHAARRAWVPTKCLDARATSGTRTSVGTATTPPQSNVSVYMHM